MSPTRFVNNHKSFEHEERKDPLVFTKTSSRGAFKKVTTAGTKQKLGKPEGGNKSQSKNYI